MILVIGGAYQGKLDYVMENQGKGKAVFHCDESATELGLSAGVINSLHLMILARTRAGLDTSAYLNEILPKLKGKILICDDISCGVVPVEREARLWRETTGRALALLSKHADEVIRVFCGIAAVIKKNES